MEILEYLTITLFAIWCVSEIVINLISFRNRSRDLYEGADRFSYFIVWFSTVPPIFISGLNSFLFCEKVYDVMNNTIVISKNCNFLIVLSFNF